MAGAKVLAIAATAPEPTSGVAGSGGEMLVSCGAAVFAALYRQPLEAAVTRNLIKTSVALPGSPQVLLQFGLARVQSGHGPPVRGRIARVPITATCDPERRNT
jgi:hypothetical protein